MTIPASISAAITALQTAITAAKPLEKAPNYTLLSLNTQMNALVTSVDVAIPAAAGALDGQDPSGAPAAIVSAFQALSASAAAQSAVVDLRGYVGRAQVNLRQVQP